MSLPDYLRDPEEIYRASRALALIETDLRWVPEDLTEVAMRLVHATADPSLVKAIRASDGAAAAGRAALEGGAAVLCDTEMVVQGVIRATLPARNPVICTLNDEAVPELAKRLGTTRSAAALELWGEALDGAVVAIGNAPTALLRLLEMLDDGAPRPALIIAMPVGFIGAAVSKQAVVDDDRGVPYVAVVGRRGGSALASAAVNALGAKGGQ